MNPDAVPFLVLGAISAGLWGLAKGAEVGGPLGIRRAKLLASLAFLITAFAFMIWVLWQDNWKSGLGFLSLLLICAVVGWRYNRFEEIRSEWRK